MPLSTYAELIAAVLDELKDDSLEAKVPQFIYLAEAQFNRMLYGPEAESTVTSTLTAAEPLALLPQDFRKLRSLYIDNNSSPVVLEQLSPDDLQARYIGAAPGQPVAFSIEGSNFRWGPSPDTGYVVTCHYVAGIPALSTTNTSNWLLDSHPDLYLYGTLRQAELYGWNDQRAALFDQFVDNVIGQIRLSDAQKRNADLSAPVAGSYF